MRGELFSPQQIEVLDRLFDRQAPCPVQSSSDLYVSPDSGKVRAWRCAGSGLRLSLGRSPRPKSVLMKSAVMCNKPLTENTDRLGQCQGKAGRDYGWSDLDVFPLVLEPIDLKPIAMIMAYI